MHRCRAAIATLTLSVLAGCGGGSSTPQAAPSTSSTPTCPLTGVAPAGDQDVKRAALAVKIDNVDDARPQAGLDHADLVVEETVEGGLTRLFVVFQCDSTDVIGPVRSARTSDIALLRLFDGAALGFSGANPKVVRQLDKSSQSVLLSYDANASLYHRATDRPAPHNVFTSTSTLLDEANKRDDSLDAPDPLFSYAANPPAAAKAAKSLALRWSPNASAAWAWKRSRWERTQNGTPDVLVDHKRVTATNVIVMRIKTKDTGIRDVVGNPSPDDVVTGSGKVWVLRDGTVITGRWKRPNLNSPLSLTDAGGGVIDLAPGRTWIELAPSDTTLKFGR